jgi:hypothetical protein
MSTHASGTVKGGFASSPSYRLAGPVAYSHPDFWGRKSSIRLEPSVPACSGHWTWSPDGGPPTAIDPNIVVTNMRRMQLHARGQQIEVYEHIGVLRFAQIFGVNIVGKGWPPYHGRAFELHKLVEPRLVEINSADIPLYGVSESVCFRDDKTIAGGSVRPFVEIHPPADSDLGLTLDIFIDYPGLGAYQHSFRLPDKNLLEEICGAHAQGWPLYAHTVAKVVRKLGWPHMDSVTWPQDHAKPEDALRLFALHRAQDLLGALSLLCQNGLFVGHVVSHCAGHRGDIQAVVKAFKHLRRLW